jgi:hypothetical protein
MMINFGKSNNFHDPVLIGWGAPEDLARSKLLLLRRFLDAASKKVLCANKSQIIFINKFANVMGLGYLSQWDAVEAKFCK